MTGSTAPAPTAGEVKGRSVVVVSPHYDDVPLSLGQSLTDGALTQADAVSVRVVFGHTNWSVRLHPTRRRAPLITSWRRGEEQLAARRFGYRVRAEPLEEVILRTGSMDPASFTDGSASIPDALALRVTRVLRRWWAEADVLWVPAGLGRHVDHRMVAGCGADLVRRGCDGIAFYEDRPYTAYLDDEEIERQLGELDLHLEPVDVSGPIAVSTHDAVRRIYRSQMDEYFLDAQRRDRESGRTERIWVPERRSA